MSSPSESQRSLTSRLPTTNNDSTPSTPPRRPFTPTSSSATETGRHFSSTPSSSSSRRPAPQTPPRNRPRSSSTLHRAALVALPDSPQVIHSTPPSSSYRFSDTLELSPLNPRERRNTDSPFDDRHSVAADEMTEVLNDEYGGPGIRRERTMVNYHFASLSPRLQSSHPTGDMTFGEQLHEVVQIPSARRSIYPPAPPIPASTLRDHIDLLPPLPSKPIEESIPPVRPSFRVLFSLTTKSDFVILIPGVITSIVAALVPPYMTTQIGVSFAVLAIYPADVSSATDSQRTEMYNTNSEACLRLAITGLIAVIANYGRGVLWTRFGERMTAKLRETVYHGVQSRGMEWFDTGMGMKLEGEEGKKNEAVGAGGLMAKFTRETDDVRLATGLATGQALQYFLTFTVCLVLALIKAPVLSLVILSTIPLVVLVQVTAQVMVAPQYSGERRAFAEASTNIERATSAIATVKAHNAQSSEENRFIRLINAGKARLVSQALIWGVTMGATDFLSLVMFVVGFWYGAVVVRRGTASAGDVMTVFWACLLGSSYLQMVVPMLTTLTKGKNSMASLMTVIQNTPSRPSSISSNPFSPSSPQSTIFQGRYSASSSIHKHSRNQSIRRIRPPRCRGEIDLRGISFAYPSRPESMVLKDVKLFLPPGETTFIVGGSGSGKSTIAQLLLRLYRPLAGEITMDDQSFQYLDEDFLKENIAAVQQGCILFDLSIHDNVAMGLSGAGRDPKTGLSRRPQDVSRQEVIDACKMAMIHDFVDSLPEGYETKLGTGGSNLSGGQKQRLAIARARIRDPVVLILDEATSALDATSRVVVFENIQKWRKNQTTIVITHDLSQILHEDFVYVMKDGEIVEQGFRSDLIRQTPLYGRQYGVFASMAAEQSVEPLPPKLEEAWHPATEIEEMLEATEEVLEEEDLTRPHTPSFQVGARPGSMMYLDIIDDYARGGRNSVTVGKGRRLSQSSNIGINAGSGAGADVGEGGALRRESRPMSLAQKRLSWSPQDLNASRRNSRNSLSAPSVRISRKISYDSQSKPSFESDSNRSLPPTVIPSEKSGDRLTVTSLAYRKDQTLSQNLDDELKGSSLSIVTPPAAASAEPVGKVMGIISLLIKFIPTLPKKYLLVLGLLGAVGHGILLPVWSSYISRLMTLVGNGGTDTASITLDGCIVLSLTAAYALTSLIQYYCLESLSAWWTTSLRQKTYAKLLQQDKSFFDESNNSPSRLVQILIKDADDMRPLMSTIIGRFVVFVGMLGLGLIWAMVEEWRLTLLGLACGPFFMLVMVFNTVVLGKYEVVNKKKREALARTFYESVANVRGIRAMALDGVFLEKFQKEAEEALDSGNIRAWVVAVGSAATAALPLFAQALMTWAIGVLMKNNLANYPTLIQVYSLVLFSLTFGAQMLDFIPAMTKAKVASRDFNRLYDLNTTPDETTGNLRFPISGHVNFQDLQFSYPTRPDVPIFTDLTFTLNPGECVAIVGPSGSGKSTIASLLQRLYTPSSGKVLMDRFNLQEADTKWLRNHIAVVSQSANLFDATVAENIGYGSDVPIGEITRAATLANIHEFVMGLPEGYETKLGENASLISGGQAQRLQIARALVRRSDILILDECTSALDVDNQRAILDTILKIKDTRTTIFITHSLEAMRRCDRIICLGEGRVVEDGSFEELVARGGEFASLMRTGEWE